MKLVKPELLKPLLTEEDEIAFIDVREHGQYGDGHPFFCVNVPFSRLESLAPRLMPSTSVLCAILDDGDEVAIRAAEVLESMGYQNVLVLEGGAPAWVDAGYTLFKGVNVPSKSFGELVEHDFETASISAEELSRMQSQGEQVLVLDGRTSPEFRKMSIPGARSCPNGELAYRVPSMGVNSDVPVVVNCAGRTRSIIGAQSLAMLGIRNKVYALSNGTQGWRLAGLDLENGSDKVALPTPDNVALKAGESSADILIRDYGLKTLSWLDWQTWKEDSDLSTYLFDVRSDQEYAAGHVLGAKSAPGGQLVQATDEQLAVRNARVVLTCDNGLRSAITAIWLLGMGHKVWLLERDVPRDSIADLGSDLDYDFDQLSHEQLHSIVHEGAIVLDASRGMDYREGHIPGAHWVTRARFNPSLIHDSTKVLLTGRDSELIAGVATEFEKHIGRQPDFVMQSDPKSWREAGLTVETSPNIPTEADCIDYLFFVHDRHDGNLEAARRYLAWELGLLDQLDKQERNVLKPLRSQSKGGTHAARN